MESAVPCQVLPLAKINDAVGMFTIAVLVREIERDCWRSHPYLTPNIPFVNYAKTTQHTKVSLPISADEGTVGMSVPSD